MSAATPGPDGIATPGGRLIEGTTDPVDAATVLLLRDGADGHRGVPARTPPEVGLRRRGVRLPGRQGRPRGPRPAARRWTGVDPAAVVATGRGAHRRATPSGCWSPPSARPSRRPACCWPTAPTGAPVTAEDLATESFLEARQRLAARGEPWDWRPVAGRGGPGARPRGAAALLVVGHPARDAQALRHPVPRRGAARGADARSATTTSRPPTRCGVRPEDAVAAAERGEVVIIFPTRRTLQALADRGSVAEVDGPPGRPPPHPAGDRAGRRRTPGAPPRRGTGRIDLARSSPEPRPRGDDALGHVPMW